MARSRARATTRRSCGDRPDATRATASATRQTAGRATGRRASRARRDRRPLAGPARRAPRTRRRAAPPPPRRLRWRSRSRAARATACLAPGHCVCCGPAGRAARAPARRGRRSTRVPDRSPCARAHRGAMASYHRQDCPLQAATQRVSRAAPSRVAARCSPSCAMPHGMATISCRAGPSVASATRMGTPPSDTAMSRSRRPTERLRARPHEVLPHGSRAARGAEGLARDPPGAHASLHRPRRRFLRRTMQQGRREVALDDARPHAATRHPWRAHRASAAGPIIVSPSSVTHRSD